MLLSGTVSFRYDYRINGRRETLVIGQYGRDGISLAEAREELIAAKKLLKAGQSPAAAKRDGIKKIRGAETFAVHTDSYMKHVILADSTRAMKQAVIDRDILPVLGNKMMAEITTSMVRDLCDRIVERGGRATAVQAREIISSVYRHANDQVMVCLILRLTLTFVYRHINQRERTLYHPQKKLPVLPHAGCHWCYGHYENGFKAGAYHYGS